MKTSFIVKHLKNIKIRYPNTGGVLILTRQGNKGLVVFVTEIMYQKETG